MDCVTYDLRRRDRDASALLRIRDSTEEGVVAVACALNIVPGGYGMRELRIPSQCVLLDYSGCRRHWHPRGIPTDISDARLLGLLGAGPLHDERVPATARPAVVREPAATARATVEGASA